VFGWERGIDHRPQEAPVFYGLYTGLIVVSGLIVLIPGLRLFVLMWLSQVANALLLPVILVLMLRLANASDLMKEWRNRRWMNGVVIVLTVLVSAATVALVVGL